MTTASYVCMTYPDSSSEQKKPKSASFSQIMMSYTLIDWCLYLVKSSHVRKFKPSLSGRNSTKVKKIACWLRNTITSVVVKFPATGVCQHWLNKLLLCGSLMVWQFFHYWYEYLCIETNWNGLFNSYNILSPLNRVLYLSCMIPLRPNISGVCSRTSYFACWMYSISLDLLHMV